MPNRYEIIIFWSDEDQAFIADVPELPGCMTHGSSHAEALTKAQDAIAIRLETAREHGDPVPEGVDVYSTRCIECVTRGAGRLHRWKFLSSSRQVSRDEWCSGVGDS